MSRHRPDIVAAQFMPRSGLCGFIWYLDEASWQVWGILGQSRLATSQAAGGSLVGSWLLTVTPSGSPVAKDLATVTADGALFVSESAPITTTPQGTGRSTEGNGAWSLLAGQQYAYTFVQFSIDAQARFEVTLKVWGRLSLDDDADYWNGPFVFTVEDATGKLLATGKGTVEATRIVVDPRPVTAR